jgi:hypothetical protein
MVVVDPVANREELYKMIVEQLCRPST